RKMKRGSGKKESELAGWFDLVAYDQPRRWRVLWPNSDSVKHELVRAFARDMNLPGALMLPRSLGVQDDIIQHLTAERWQYNQDLKRKAWTKIGRFNDYWDCSYYNLALGQYWLTEHPNYRPTGGPVAQRPQRDDDTPNLSWSENLGWQ
ncbi:MAG: phage terminase large subunit family protein, partial [Planctomycetes bacterium]|nr:phage terminase large subunit family protein [Planctomycetota bacterium]